MYEAIYNNCTETIFNNHVNNNERDEIENLRSNKLQKLFNLLFLNRLIFMKEKRFWYFINYVMYHKDLSTKHLQYTLSISSQIEPYTYEKVVTSSNWVKAKKNEIDALERNQSW